MRKAIWWSIMTDTWNCQYIIPPIRSSFAFRTSKHSSREISNKIDLMIFGQQSNSNGLIEFGGSSQSFSSVAFPLNWQKWLLHHSGHQIIQTFQEVKNFLIKFLTWPTYLYLACPNQNMIVWKNRSPKGNMWSPIPVALLCMAVNRSKRKQGSGTEGDKVL